MAYNPFDFFRRNQKTAFAALTVFVMFTFVLSFGQGDFFQWLPGWLGSFKNRGKDVMAEIDGRKLYDVDLAKHDDDRALADEFMKSIVTTVARDMDENLREGVKSAGKEAKETIQDFLQQRPNYVDLNMLRLFQQRGIQLTQNDILGMQQRTKQRIQSAITQIQLADGTTGDKDLAKQAAELMRLDNQVERINMEGAYFNRPGRSRSNEDRLEYELWLRKADKLGIAIRPEDAPALVKDDLGSQVTPEVWNATEKTFFSKIGFTRARLLAALANEFRVRAAFDIVVGRAAPPPAPFETFQFFKEQCDAATYTMMSVPAENFLDKVGQPSDADLRTLYDKYKGIEPDPARETPGFREPRKLKIAWVEVKGDEPYYKKQAEAVWKDSEAGVRLAGLGFGTTAPVASALTSSLVDPALQAAYANYRARFESNLRSQWTLFTPFSNELLDSSVLRPQNVAAVLGSLVASGLTKGSPISARVLLQERAAQFERNDRARVLAALLIPGGPAGSNVLGKVLVGGAALPVPPPLAAVRNDLIDGVKADLARSRAQLDIQEFAKELARLGAKKDKSEARGYVDKFLAERGLTHGASTEFRDQYSMDEDPGLAVLAEKKDRGHGLSEVNVRFGPRFFANPNDRRGVAPLTYFDPTTFPDQGPGMFVNLRAGEPTYLTWRTESIEPQTPREFKDAREKVEAAWKRMKARELAKAAAEDLRKRIDEKLKEEKVKEDENSKLNQIVSDAHTKFQFDTYGNGAGAVDKMLRAKYFIVDRVAPIRIDRNPLDVMNQDGQPVPYNLGHLERKELPYPSLPLARALIDAKGKPRGTTVLEADRPNDVYYVAVLVGRVEHDKESFRNKGIAEGRTPLAGAVRDQEFMLQRAKVRETAIALLKAEFKVANESEKLKEKTAGGE